MGSLLNRNDGEIFPWKTIFVYRHAHLQSYTGYALRHRGGTKGGAGASGSKHRRHSNTGGSLPLRRADLRSTGRVAEKPRGAAAQLTTTGAPFRFHAAHMGSVRGWVLTKAADSFRPAPTTPIDSRADQAAARPHSARNKHHNARPRSVQDIASMCPRGRAGCGYSQEAADLHRPAPTTPIYAGSQEHLRTHACIRGAQMHAYSQRPYLAAGTAASLNTRSGVK